MKELLGLVRGVVQPLESGEVERTDSRAGLRTPERSSMPDQTGGKISLANRGRSQKQT